MSAESIRHWYSKSFMLDVELGRTLLTPPCAERDAHVASLRARIAEHQCAAPNRAVAE
jgi:hypothetical protein